MTETPTFDLLDWIERGTAARRTVVIYNDPALVAEYEELERQLRTAETGSGEHGLGESSPVQHIEAQMAALWERWEASKATWTVQALADDTIREIAAAHPLPDDPSAPADDADAETVAAYEAAIAARRAASDERNFAMIAAAVVSVETQRGTVTAVPVEAIRALRRRPHGAVQTEMLLRAVRAATAGDVEIPAPKSVRPSETDQA